MKNHATLTCLVVLQLVILLAWSTSGEIAKPVNYKITTLFGGLNGDGQNATSVGIYTPKNVAVSQYNGNIYYTEYSNHQIRYIKPDGNSYVLAGDPCYNSDSNMNAPKGPTGVETLLRLPFGLTVSNIKDEVYFTDSYTVRKVYYNSTSGNYLMLLVAGSGSDKTSGVSATSAKLNSPSSVVLDEVNDVIYIADTFNYLIRKVANGTIFNIAGDINLSGSATDNNLAEGDTISEVVSLALHPITHELYYLESSGSVRFIDSSGKTQTYYSSTDQANAMTFDSEGNLYITEKQFSKIAKITSNKVRTYIANNLGTVGFSGDGGSAVNASLFNPIGMAISGTNLYVADSSNLRIRKIDLNSTIITTIAGDGTSRYMGSLVGNSTTISLNEPRGTFYNSQTDELLIVDQGNSRVLRLNSLSQYASSRIETILGTGKSEDSPEGNFGNQTNVITPYSVFQSESSGDIYVGSENLILKLQKDTQRVSTIAGSRTNLNADGYRSEYSQLVNPGGLCVGPSGEIFIMDRGNFAIRKIDNNGIITTIVGDGTSGFSDGYTNSSKISTANAITCLQNGDIIFSDSYNQRIRKFSASTNQVSTLAGDGRGDFIGDNGPALNASLKDPNGIHYNETTGDILFCDSSNNRIRKIDNNGIVTTIAGSGNPTYNGEGINATLANISPQGIAVHPITGEIYFSDLNYLIRKIDHNGNIYSVIGNAQMKCSTPSSISKANETCLPAPAHIAFSPNGDLFIAVTQHHVIKKMDYATNVVYNVAGSGSCDVNIFSEDNNATLSRICNPYGVAYSTATNELLLSETTFNRVRKINILGVLKTIAGGIGENGLAVNTRVGPVKALAVTDNEVYFSDNKNYRLRKVTLSTGIINTVVGSYDYTYLGDGLPANQTNLYNVFDIRVKDNNLVFISSLKCSILKTDSSGQGIVTRIAGSVCSSTVSDGSSSSSATFKNPWSIAYLPSGELIIADTENHVIRKVSLNRTVTTISGIANSGSFNGDSSDAKQVNLNRPAGLSVLNDGRIIFSDIGNNRIRVLSPYCKDENYFLRFSSKEGMICSALSCFGLLSNDTNVCSGNGKCIGIDSCSCNGDYFGNDCSQKPKLETIRKSNGFVKGKTGSLDILISSAVFKVGSLASLIISNNCSNCTWTNLKYSWSASDGFSTIIKDESEYRTIAYYYGKNSNDESFKVSFMPLLSLKGTIRETLQGNVTLTLKFYNSNNLTEVVQFKEEIPLVSPPKRLYSNVTISPESGVSLSTLFTFYEDVSNWVLTDSLLSPLTFSFGFEYFNSLGERSLIRISEFSTNSSISTYLPFLNHTNSVKIYIICRDSLSNEYTELFANISISANTEDSNTLVYRIRSDNRVAQMVPYDQIANQLNDIIYESVKNTEIQIDNPSVSLTVIKQFTMNVLETRVSMLLSSKLETYLSKVNEIVRNDKITNGYLAKQQMSDNDTTNTLTATSNILSNGYVNISSICSQLSAIILIQQNAQIYSNNLNVNSFVSNTINITTVNYVKSLSNENAIQQFEEITLATDYILTKYDGYYKEIGLTLISFDENLYSNGNSTQLTKSKDFTLYKSSSPLPLSDLVQPISITFQLESNSSITHSLLRCQYWNETTQKWEGNGCLVSNFNNLTNQLTCQCNHTTLFAAFVEQETPSSEAYLKAVSSLYIAQISFGSLFLILASVILILLIAFRKSQPVASRFITPFFGMIALIIECAMILITQRGILLGYANSVLGIQTDFENSQSTMVQLQNGDLAANIVSNVFTIIVNTMTLTAIFSYLYQVLRFQILKYFYHQIQIRFNTGTESKKETILKITKLFLTTRVMIIVMSLFISMNVIYWTLWVILIRVGSINGSTYTFIVSISFTCSILALGFVICCLIVIEFLMSVLSSRKQQEIITQGQKQDETDSNINLNDLINGKSLDKLHNTKKLIKIPLKGIQRFINLDSPLYFRAEMLLFILCFTFLVISQIIGLSGLTFRNQDSLQTLLLNDSMSLVFDILYMFTYLFVFGGYSLCVLALQSKKKAIKPEEDIPKLLEHVEGLKLFEWFCKKEYSLENLQLYLELVKFKPVLLNLDDFQQVKTAINHIYRTYIQKGALKEINIPSECSKAFLKIVNTFDSGFSNNIELESKNGKKNLSQELKTSIMEAIESLHNQILFNLSDTFSRFIFTNQFKTYQEVMTYKEIMMNNNVVESNSQILQQHHGGGILRMKKGLSEEEEHEMARNEHPIMLGNNDDNYQSWTSRRNIDEVLIQPSSVQPTNLVRSTVAHFNIFINENVNYDNSSTCNITSPCSNFGQAMDYLASLDENTRLKIFLLQVYLMSNVTVCKNVWRNELNPSMETFFNSYPLSTIRSIDCNGAKFFVTDFVDSNSRLNIHFSGFRIKNTSFRNERDLVSFFYCDIESATINIERNSKTTILKSQVNLSSIQCMAGYFEIYQVIFNNSKIRAFNTIGSPLIHPITIQDSMLLEGSILSLISFQLEANNLTVLDSSVEINSAPYIGLNNFTASNSLMKFEVVNKMEMQDFEIFNNNKPVLFSGINILIMNNGTVRDCKVTYDAALAFRTILSMHFEMVKFIRNRRAIFSDNTRTMQFKYCEFLQNYQGVSLQNFEKNRYATYSFYFCNFIENYYPDGDGGAVQMISQDSLRFTKCKFENNYARNGGAIYSNTETIIELSTFINNSAIPYGYDCTEITCGNGGGFYVKGIISIEDVELLGNRATKGGACFMDHVTQFDIFGNQLYSNNVATFSGDDIFLYDTYTTLLSTTTKKIAQANIGSMKLITQNGSKNITLEDAYLTLYPGQSISFTFELFDMYGTQINKVQKSPTFYSYDESITLKTVVNSTNNITFNSFSYQVNGKIPTKDLQILISFANNFKNFILYIQPIDCPYGYSFKQQFESEFSQYACVKEHYEAIIASTVMGTVLVILVLLGCSIAAYFIGTRLYKLYKREQAEKSLAKKLIDKQFIFGRGSELTESLLPSNGKARQLKSQCDNMIIPLSNIEIISKIGEGSNGVVYKALYNGTPVALKTLKLDSLSEEENSEFEHEAALLSSLKHPSIVTFYGISIGVNVKYMIVEFMPNGSLDHLIRECKSGKMHITLRQKINIILGIANGLSYLHNLKPLSIIHRDIKPGNVLLDHSYQAKVSDFGLSKLTSNNNSSTMTSNLGTVLYMAPEVIMEGEYEISNKLDVYSFAIIMYELFFEVAPFAPGSSKLNRFSKDEKEVKNLLSIPYLVAKGERPKIPFTNQEEQSIWIEEFMNEKDMHSNPALLFNIVSDYIHLMQISWSQDPNQRPAFTEVVTLLSKMLSNWKGI